MDSDKKSGFLLNICDNDIAIVPALLLFLPSVCVSQEMARRGVANPIFKVLKVLRSVQRN
jgi:hypothetical protein